MELRTLHFTDFEDDLTKVEAVKEYIAGKKETDDAIDAVFMTGDWIQAHPHLYGTAQQLLMALEQHAPSEELDHARKEFIELNQQLAKAGKKTINDLTEDEKKQFQAAQIVMNREEEKRIQAHADKLLDPLTTIINESYQTIAQTFSNFGAPVYGVMGNHDFTLGYDLLEDAVTFVDNKEKAVITGRSGVEFTVKGDINSWEIPAFYGFLSPVLEKYFAPFISGHSLSGLSQTANKLQQQITEGRQGRLEQIAKREEPKVSDQQLKEMEEQLEYVSALRSEVLEYQKKQRQRLGEKNADIYLTHKLPHNDKSNPKYVPPFSGEITLEYSANAQSVHGGHFEEGQIGYKTLADFFKQATAKTTVVDGVEVPVFHLDEKEPWELNPGEDRFFIVEHGRNKEIERVVIYKFVDA